MEEELLDLLETIFDAYEEGPDCYEDPDECVGYLGKAVKLDDATFQRVADILNMRRPRQAKIVRHGELTPNVEVQGREAASLPSVPLQRHVERKEEL